MTSPRIVALGVSLPALARIEQVGRLLGLSRGVAYRTCVDWPLVGPETNRRVVVPRLLDELGIPYEIEEAGDEVDGNS